MDDTNGAVDVPERADGDRPRARTDAYESRSHYALVYENQREQLAATTAFLREGIRNEEACFAVCDDEFVDELERALRVEGVAVTDALERGQLAFESPRETFLKRQERTARSLTAWLEALIDDSDGEPIRVTGDMAWASEAVPDTDVLVEYERIMDGVLAERPAVALCQYPLTEFPDELLYDVLSHHPKYRSPFGSCSNVFHGHGPSVAADDDAVDVARIVDVLEALSRRASRRDKVRTIASLDESIDVDDTDEMADLVRYVCRLVDSIFSPSLTTVWLYDSETGELSPEPSATESAFPGLEAITTAVSGQAWDAFAGGTGVRTERIPAENVPEAVADLPVDESVFVPLGRRGVLMMVFPDYVPLADADVATLETLKIKVRATLDRLSYRAEVDEHRSRLEERTERTRELEEVIALLRSTNRKLRDATSRADAERAVCEELVTAPFVQFALYEPAGSKGQGGAEAYVRAGTRGSGYLEAVDASAADPVVEPAATTARTSEATVVSDLYTDPPFDPWREQALRRGFHSIACVPVRFRDSTYGVLSVFSDQPNAFDDRTLGALEAVGRSAGHAINACEARKALISDRVTELEICVRDDSLPSISLARGVDSEVTFEGIVPQTEGPPRTYLAVHDCERREVEAVAARYVGAREFRHVVERDDGHLFVGSVDGPCVFKVLLDHGGVPCAMTATKDEAEITLELPEQSSTRSFVSMLEDLFDEVRIASKETREREYRARDEFKREFDERLTDRQKEVLRTAYYSGFFDAPRESTGGDIAEQLDVTQPTVTENIRSAERELLELLFDP